MTRESDHVLFVISSRFDAFYSMTELIDLCGGEVTTDYQVRGEVHQHTAPHSLGSSINASHVVLE